METNFMCDYCGKSFPAKRNTAIYCSNSHRTLANKQRKKDKIVTEKWRKEKEDRVAEEQILKDELSEKRKQKALFKLMEKEKVAEAASLDVLAKKQEADQSEAGIAETKRQPEVEDQQKNEKPQLEVLEQKIPVRRKRRFQKTDNIEYSVQKANNRIAGALIVTGFIFKIIESVFKDPEDKPKDKDKSDPHEETKG